MLTKRTTSIEIIFTEVLDWKKRESIKKEGIFWTILMEATKIKMMASIQGKKDIKMIK